MTLEQLQYFVAIVESATFFDAAESLHIAQSTLSKQIRNLELELDVQLFDRSRRHASLTDAGRILYPDAVKLLKGVQGMKQHLAPYQDSRRSILHLGVLPILHQYRLNPVLRQFAESHPEITLMIERWRMNRCGRLPPGQLRSDHRPPGTAYRRAEHMPSAGSRPAGASDSRRPSAGRQTSRSPGRAVRRIVYSDASQQQHLPPVPHGLPKKDSSPLSPGQQDRIHCQRSRRRRGGEPASLQ